MLNKIEPNEMWNVITHAFGLLLSIIASTYFYTYFTFESARVLVALIIYCFSLVFLFSASTIYHSTIGARKIIWRKVDHIAILFLIAGTYTPVTLTLLYETSGILILSGVWIITGFGIVFKAFYTGRFENISLVMYLLMGWFILIDIKSVFEFFSNTALTFLVLGGLFYTSGIFFYKWEKFKESHAIWHVFVLAGAICHFFMVREVLILN